MSREQQNKAKDLIQLGQWQEAIEALNQAQQEEGENPWIMSSLAFCHSRLKHYQEAIELYERLCTLQPTVARWPYGLGYQYYDQQNWSRAIEYFDQALKLEPEYIVALYRKGYALSRLDGRQAEALTTFELCRQSYLALPGGEDKDRERKTYADACYQQGKLFLDGNKASLAVERLRAAAALDFDDSDVHYHLGKAYLALSRWDEALTSLKTALLLSAQPEHYVLDAIAEAHAGAGRLQEAISVYEQMDVAVRGRPYILRNLGTVYSRLEQYEKAERTLQEAVRKEPGNHNGHYRLGRVYEQMKKWAEASGEYKTAIDLRQRTYGLPFPEAEKDLAVLISEHPEAKDAPRPRPPALLPQDTPASPVVQESPAVAPPRAAYPSRPAAPVRPAQTWPASPQPGSTYPTRQAAPVRPAQTWPAAPQPASTYPTRQAAPVRPAQTSYTPSQQGSTYPTRQAAPIRPAQTRSTAPQQGSAYPTRQAAPVRPAQTWPAAPQQGSAYPTRQAAPVRPAQTWPAAPQQGSAYPTRQGAPIRPAQTRSSAPQQGSAYPTRQAAPIRPAQTRSSAPQPGSAYPTRQAAPVRPAQTWRRDAPASQGTARHRTFNRAVGRVKSFFAEKGFGFIEAGGGQPDLFFHMSEVEGRPVVQPGDQMEYSIGEGTRGPIAVDLKVVGTQKHD
jgi:tetratricopeptide (TPR) repeat protein/cold shock CspA family protein